MSNLRGDVAGPHWEALRELLPAYRCITQVSLGNGTQTSFWHDRWLDGHPLAVHFPSLHSHFTAGDVSVRQVLDCGVDTLLQHRLTPQAEDELEKLQRMLLGAAISDTPDNRACAFIKKEGGLATSKIYKASTRGDQKVPSFAFIWNNFAPPRVMFFGWLLIQGRIQCKTNLERKRVLPDAVCALCNTENEDTNHIILGCPFAASFWARVGWQPEETDRIWETTTLPGTPRVAAHTFLLLCC